MEETTQRTLTNNKGVSTCFFKKQSAEFLLLFFFLLGGGKTQDPTGRTHHSPRQRNQTLQVKHIRPASQSCCSAQTGGRIQNLCNISKVEPADSSRGSSLYALLQFLLPPRRCRFRSLTTPIGALPCAPSSPLGSRWWTFAPGALRGHNARLLSLFSLFHFTVRRALFLPAPPSSLLPLATSNTPPPVHGEKENFFLPLLLTHLQPRPRIGHRRGVKPVAWDPLFSAAFSELRASAALSIHDTTT